MTNEDIERENCATNAAEGKFLIDTVHSIVSAAWTSAVLHTIIIYHGELLEVRCVRVSVF